MYKNKQTFFEWEILEHGVHESNFSSLSRYILDDIYYILICNEQPQYILLLQLNLYNNEKFFFSLQILKAVNLISVNLRQSKLWLNFRCPTRNNDHICACYYIPLISSTNSKWTSQKVRQLWGISNIKNSQKIFMKTWLLLVCVCLCVWIGGFFQVCLHKIGGTWDNGNPEEHHLRL